MRQAIAAVLFFCAAVFAQSDSSRARVAALGVTPFYEKAAPGQLPSGYLNKGDTCTVERVLVDTSGLAWFFLCRGESSVWSPASGWRYVAAASDELSGARKEEEEDRKRRLRVLQEHRDWPRRVIRAVREGKVCLDMTSEQLGAAWGEPAQKSRSFTLGLGNHDTWFYAGDGGSMHIVSLQNDRVIGWSLGN